MDFIFKALSGTVYGVGWALLNCLLGFVTFPWDLCHVCMRGCGDGVQVSTPISFNTPVRSCFTKDGHQISINLMASI